VRFYVIALSNESRLEYEVFSDLRLRSEVECTDILNTASAMRECLATFRGKTVSHLRRLVFDGKYRSFSKMLRQAKTSDAGSREFLIARLFDCDERQFVRVDVMLDAYRASCAGTVLKLDNEPKSGHFLDTARDDSYADLEKVGGGGMGEVFRAWQNALGRLVAIKFLNSNLRLSQAAQCQFETEVASAAKLFHKGLVPVLDRGTIRVSRDSNDMLQLVTAPHGVPERFYAMEFVNGISLRKLLERNKTMTAREAAELIHEVALTIHYAHENNVVHCDLKPENILLIEEKMPGSDIGRPRIVDFGVARLMGASGQANSLGGGTPAYMAPEQFISLAPADLKSDIYALGILLWEQTTGKPPHEASTSAELLEAKYQVSSAIAYRSDRKLSPDFAAIARKCIQPNKRLRYATALDLANDLRLFLSGKEVTARPIQATERIRKFARRKPALSGLLAVIAAAIVTLISGLWIGNSVVTEKNRSLTEKTTLAQQRLIDQRYGIGLNLLNSNRYFDALPWLAHAIENRPNDSSPTIPRLQIHNFTRVLPGIEAMLFHDAPVKYCEFSLDGTQIATASGKYAYVWNRAQNTKRKLPHNGDVLWVSFSKNGKQLATVSLDKKARVWDLDSLIAETELTVTDGVPYFSSVDPSGEHVLIGVSESDEVRKVIIWTWRSNTSRSFPLAPQASLAINSLISHDGKFLALASANQVNIWDLTRKNEKPRWVFSHNGMVKCMDMSHDGQWIAIGGEDGMVKQWSLTNGNGRSTVPLWHSGPVEVAKYSLAGATLLTKANNVEFLYDSSTGKYLPYEGFESVQNYIPLRQLSPDHRYSLNMIRNVVRVMDLAGLSANCSYFACLDDVTRMSFSPHGTRATVYQKNGAVNFLDVIAGKNYDSSPTGDCHDILPGDDPLEAFIAVGNQVFKVLADRSKPTIAVERSDVIQDIDFQVRTLACAGNEGVTLVQVDPPNERIELPHPGESVYFAKLNESAERLLTVATGRKNSTVRLWDTNSETIVATLEGEISGKFLYFSRDGKRVVGTEDIGKESNKLLCAWDAATGKHLFPPIELQDLSGLAASADCSRGIIMEPSQNFMIVATNWELVDGAINFISGALTHNGDVISVAISPDGRFVATGGVDKTARVWEFSTSRPVTPPLVHEGPVKQLEFSPDGKRLLTFSGTENVARMWQFGDEAAWNDQDLIELSELYSQRRIRNDGVEIEIPTEQVEADWKRLQERHPVAMRPSLTQEFNYHRQQVDSNWKLQEWSEVIRHIDSLLSGDNLPKQSALAAYFLYLRGRIYLNSEDLEKATDSLKQSLKAFPDDPKAWVYLGQIYNQQKKWPQVIDSLSKAEDLLPRKQRADDFADAFIYKTRGWARACRKEWSGAAEDFRRAIKLDKQSELEYEHYWAICVLTAGQYEEYCEQRGELLKNLQSSNDPNTLWKLAMLCMLAPFDDRAIVVVADQTESSDTPPTKPIRDVIRDIVARLTGFYSHQNARWLVGIVYVRSEMPQYALGPLKMEIQSAKSDTSVARERLALALALYQSGEPTEAREQTRIALEWLAAQSDRSDYGWNYVGEVTLLAAEVAKFCAIEIPNIAHLATTESIQNEINALDAKLAADPSDRLNKLQRALLRMRLGALQPAMAAWKLAADDLGEVIKNNRSPELAYYRGLALVYAGDLAAYQELCRTMVESTEPNAPNAWWIVRLVGLAKNEAVAIALQKQLVSSAFSYGINGQYTGIRAQLRCVEVQPDGVVRNAVLDAADQRIAEAQDYIAKLQLTDNTRLDLMRAISATLRGNTAAARQLISSSQTALAGRLVLDSYAWEQELESRLWLRELHQQLPIPSLKPQ